MDVKETISGLTQELRRGTLIIGVLSQLFEPQYGYSLVSTLEDKGITIDPSTLYPLLRRLEKQELLESKWDTSEARPRKYYLIIATGKEVYQQLCLEWKSMMVSMESLIGGEDRDGIN